MQEAKEEPSKSNRRLHPQEIASSATRLTGNAEAGHEPADMVPCRSEGKFSEWIEIDKAKSEGPQKITKYGRTRAVAAAAEEWEQKAAGSEFSIVPETRL